MARTASKTQKSTRRGFTLIELALVVSVAGLLMATTVPKAVAVRRQMELNTAAHRLAQELKAAQHEAVRRNAPVTVTRVGNDAYMIGTRRVTLPDGIKFVGSSPATLTFNPFGPIAGGVAQTFGIKYASVRTGVSVSPSGMVAVERPGLNTEPVAEPTPVVEPVLEPVVDVIEPVTEIVIDPLAY